MKWPHITLSQTVRIRLLAFVTIAVTAVISFSSLRNLADRAGFHNLAWLFPVCLDAVAALGMDLWLSNSPARRGARTLALGAIVLSTAGNVFDWGIRSALWAVPVWLAPVLGAIPPIGLASLLLVLHQHGGSTRGPSPARHESGATETESLQHSRGFQDHPAPITPEATVPAGVDLQLAPSTPVDGSSTGRSASAKTTRVPRRSRGAGTRQVDLEMIETIRRMESEGTTFSRRGAMTQFRVGSKKATELLAAARNGQGANR
jgi:hypothetical protein